MLIDNLWEERDWGISSVCREFVSLCVHIGFCLVLWKVFPGNEPVQSWPLVLYLSEDSIDWNSDFFFFFFPNEKGIFSKNLCGPWQLLSNILLWKLLSSHFPRKHEVHFTLVFSLGLRHKTALEMHLEGIQGDTTHAQKLSQAEWRHHWTTACFNH